jgi:hypothetical protein
MDPFTATPKYFENIRLFAMSKVMKKVEELKYFEFLTVLLDWSGADKIEMSTSYEYVYHTSLSISIDSSSCIKISYARLLSSVKVKPIIRTYQNSLSHRNRTNAYVIVYVILII